MHAIRTAAIAAAIAAAIPAAAADGYPPAIRQAVDSGVKVVRRFAAASKLTGWVLSQGGRYSIVYTTPDKKTLLAGALIGEHGESLSRMYEDQFVPKPDLAADFGRLEKAAWVAEGAGKNAKSIVYAFVDPNCPFCRLAWRAFQPYEAAGLQVRWLEVATLGPTSMPKAVEVLGAPDRLAAFRRMEENQGKPWTPAAGAGEAAHPALVAAIRQNGELMEQFGIAGTPGIVWRDRQGQVHVKSGMPRLSEFAGITGLPEQALADPAFARFR